MENVNPNIPGYEIQCDNRRFAYNFEALRSHIGDRRVFSGARRAICESNDRCTRLRTRFAHVFDMLSRSLESEEKHRKTMFSMKNQGCQ
jgi:hypothetical protein